MGLCGHYYLAHGKYLYGFKQLAIFHKICHELCRLSCIDSMNSGENVSAMEGYASETFLFIECKPVNVLT